MTSGLPKPGNCHVCGYDLVGRAPRDICPECGTPFDIRPDAPRSHLYARFAVYAAAAAIPIMPFVALASFGLVVLAAWFKNHLDRTPPSQRLTPRVRAHQRLAKRLINVAVLEFIGLTALSLLVPGALNWW